MINCINSWWKFLNYWYFRYLMVTELYMVEKWERAVCNITIIIFLSLLTFFNCALLRYVARVFDFGPTPEAIYNSSAT